MRWLLLCWLLRRLQWRVSHHHGIVQDDHAVLCVIQTLEPTQGRCQQHFIQLANVYLEVAVQIIHHTVQLHQRVVLLATSKYVGLRDFIQFLIGYFGSLQCHGGSIRQCIAK